MSPTSTLDAEARALLAAPECCGGAWTAGLPPWLADGARGFGISHCIDHTLLRPDATRADVERAADEGRRFGVAAVCVNGAWARLVAGRLAGSGVRTAIVVGFPLGASAGRAKAREARLAVEDGADELDMVLPIGPAIALDWAMVVDDIRGVVDAAGERPVKVILETAALAPGTIVAAALAARLGGAAFVKTSTGFHPAGGATEAAVHLMRRAVGSALGVKASGGVQTAAAALAMLAAGANRIGTSSTAAMAAVLGPDAPPLAHLLAEAQRTASAGPSAGS